MNRFVAPITPRLVADAGNAGVLADAARYPDPATPARQGGAGTGTLAGPPETPRPRIVLGDPGNQASGLDLECGMVGGTAAIIVLDVYAELPRIDLGGTPYIRAALLARLTYTLGAAAETVTLKDGSSVSLKLPDAATVLLPAGTFGEGLLDAAGSEYAAPPAAKRTGENGVASVGFPQLPGVRAVIVDPVVSAGTADVWVWGAIKS
ncbi:MAG: hypothetical protein AAGF47_03760 [Planctomycetota bacterium]